MALLSRRQDVLAKRTVADALTEIDERDSRNPEGSCEAFRAREEAES